MYIVFIFCTIFIEEEPLYCRFGRGAPLYWQFWRGGLNFDGYLNGKTQVYLFI